jgi:alpha-glucosidase
VFYPYCRTHVEMGAPSQEPWSYGNRLERINRQSIELRYRLLLYLYNIFHQTSETGLPVMRALLLDYPDDPDAVGQNNEFLFGDDLLVSPVVKDGRAHWRVYLPKGVWYDFWTGRRYAGPAGVEVGAPLDRIPVFVRRGAILPTRPVVQYVSQAAFDPLTFEIIRWVRAMARHGTTTKMTASASTSSTVCRCGSRSPSSLRETLWRFE